ncbi:AAA family ATPase [Glycocaulis sp.]|uniref:AAA family ATPase n=1 Tax=Glycocaulis sp. TaxID=1969725 RepID=UPI003F6E8853
MEIKSVKVSSLHGYLDFNIKFRRDLTFIYGINGQGKTSIVLAIVSLIQPDIHWLITNEFKSIEVKFNSPGAFSATAENNGSSLAFILKKDGEIIGEAALSLSLVEEYNLLSSDEAAFDSSNRIMDFVKAEFINSSFYKEPHKLPTPFFLGLERTSPARRINISRRRRSAPQRLRSNRQTPLTYGVSLAEEVIVERYRKISISRAKLDSDFRKQLVLSVFHVTPHRRVFGEHWPNQTLIKKYKDIRDKINPILKRVDFSDEDISTHISPVFEDLIETAEKLVQIGRPSADVFFNSDKSQQRLITKWLEISTRVPIFNKISEIIDGYEKLENEIYSSSYMFCDFVNEFLKESGKSIHIDESGNVGVDLPNDKTQSPTDMSSGEMQIFLLMAHVIFNLDVKDANCLIIDEPELSLHVQWQEMFVEALQAANSSMQYIFATHSPSIIGNRVNNCVGL